MKETLSTPCTEPFPVPRIPVSPCHLSPAGRCFLLAAVVLLGIGVHRNINLLMLLGYAMLVMSFLNFLAARRSVRGLRGRRRIAEWVFARTPCVVEVQVSNPNRRTRYGLRIEDGEPSVAASLRDSERGGGATAPPTATWSVDQLPSLGTLSWRRNVVLPRRGRYKWGAIRASSGYPFGLVERRVPLTAEEDLIVLPGLGWLHRGRFLRHLRGLSLEPRPTHLRRQPYPHPAAQAEFHGLRAYQSGDSPRLIHWRTSARRGALMVREFEDVPGDNLLLVIDPTLPAESEYCDVPLREQFEEAIRLTATICWEWCRRRGDQLVFAAAGTNAVVLEGVTGPAHGRRVLECLAVLECVTGPSDLSAIERLRALRLPPAIIVLVALGRSGLAEPLRQTMGRRVYCLDAARTDHFDFYTPPS